MNLKHVFKSECPDIEALFDNCNTLDAYFNNLQSQVQNVKTSDYVKHGFECLVEAIIKSERRTMRIKDYSVIPSCNKDLFVNGVGKKSMGQKISVMVCLVNDIDIPLTSNANHLTAFTSNSTEHYGVNPDEPKAMRIFSNAKLLHENTLSQFFSDKSVCFYLKSDIEAIINENKKFWLRFKNAMKSVSKKSGVKDIVLREYQREGVSAILSSLKGQVILPTGTGKSLIAIDSLYQEIKYLDNKSPCFLIMTPRIVLTYQLLGETISYLKSKGVDAQYLNLNSGIFDDDLIKESMAEQGLPIRDVPSTTTKSEIEFYYDKACQDGVPFIISATYQSAPRILDTKIKIHMAIHDEAHNLVDGIGRFGTGVKLDVLKIEGAREIFLTATPAFTDSNEGTGMNNEAEYGKEIYRKSPKEMIEAGEIVPPYIHQIIIDEYKMKKMDSVVLDKMSDDIEKNVEFMSLVIEEAFNEHLKKIKQYSCSPEKIGAKLLVVCRGDDTFQGFFNSEGFRKIRGQRKDIKFFGISSRYGAWIDGERVPVQGGWYKEQFMLALRNLKTEDNAIILHIDMLGEGVDVPGITGVLPFRDLGTIKSCQTLGRAMRLVSEDRISLYNGSREARDTSKMIKPFAWVVVPVYSINHKDMHDRVIKIATQIRNDMGFMPFEIGGLGKGEGGNVELNTVPAKGKIPDEVALRHIVENPYFVALTEEAINDSVNGDDDNDDFFTIIRRLYNK